MAKTTTIKASSRASIKLGESYFTVEYTEERTVDENDNLDEQREDLWSVVNEERDIQIEDLMDEYRARNKRK